MKREDAESLLTQLLQVNEQLRGQDIVPVKVKLRPTIMGIASDKTPDQPFIRSSLAERGIRVHMER